MLAGLAGGSEGATCREYRLYPAPTLAANSLPTNEQDSPIDSNWQAKVTEGGLYLAAMDTCSSAIIRLLRLCTN